MFIITPKQLPIFRGKTPTGGFLDPIPLKDGTYGIPEDYISNPLYEVRHEHMAKLPRRDVQDWEFLTSNLPIPIPEPKVPEVPKPIDLEKPEEKILEVKKESLFKKFLNILGR